MPTYLRNRLVVETSPSGGKHVYFRVPDGVIPGNRKLAMKADGKVLIETRGEGGYVKCAPSEGYVLQHGDFANLPVLSAFEQNYIVDLAKELDEMRSVTQVASRHTDCAKSDVATTPASLATPRSAFRAVVSSHDELSPCDDYNSRGDFAALLESHGWKRVKSGDNEHWERPGKDDHSYTTLYTYPYSSPGFHLGTHGVHAGACSLSQSDACVLWCGDHALASLGAQLLHSDWS